MKINARGLAGILTLAAIAGCNVNVTSPATGTKVNVLIKNNSTGDKQQSFTATLFGADKANIDSLYSPNQQADLDGSFDVLAAGTYYLKVTADNSTVASKLTVSAP